MHAASVSHIWRRTPGNTDERERERDQRNVHLLSSQPRIWSVTGPWGSSRVPAPSCLGHCPGLSLVEGCSSEKKKKKKISVTTPETSPFWSNEGHSSIVCPTRAGPGGGKPSPHSLNERKKDQQNSRGGNRAKILTPQGKVLRVLLRERTKPYSEHIQVGPLEQQPLL